MENDGMKRLCGMLGFAMRAGKLIIGTENICRALSSSKGKERVRLVVIACDASDLTKKKLYDKSKFYETEAKEVNITTEELGRMLGKSYAPAASAVTDEGFAKEISAAADLSRKILRKEVSD